ncbi:conserved hypothetical protein [uncultured Desulfobacterium sp.]|uniref:Uncharacterized protein n=1 Tax=uncultured Desulfobacterium sp. TaxID=201089 RepID=A0A445MX19_9BACT|nr:conserved hypothetical protein [uncultured Desulfobacterium sp.]
MAKILHLETKITGPTNNIITARPIEFRRSFWDTTHFIQMGRASSKGLERHRKEAHNKGGAAFGQIPPHHLLTGGMDSTIRALFIHREDEQKMREIYYFVGLVDCMINQVNPLLRTDIIRDMYRKVFKMREDLKIHWHGNISQILLPIDSVLFDENEYKAMVSKAGTMKELYKTIKDGTDEMFDIISLEYVFYCPSAGRNH